MHVQADLSEDHTGFIIDPYVIVACFLVREGGDLHIKNNNGISPYQLCPSDIGVLISTFVQKHGWVSNLSLLFTACLLYQPSSSYYSSYMYTEVL